MDMGKVIIKNPGRTYSKKKINQEVKLGLEDGCQGKIPNRFKARLENISNFT